MSCHCCFYHIHDLRHLSVTKTIAITLITSRLDYCNSLLYNIISKDILKHQGVGNYLARVVTLFGIHSMNMLSHQMVYSFFMSPFENSPFQNCLSFLGFHSI
ncbi:hypothetical protein LSH36_127g03000 [Paralvinella palmiformis]|uniref:Uncharacterized protein n=1 Tax=Paralvinella palmiformis TaxID=53620 RepID=A0AAD9JWU9_9ANNE|nr:hypothetical protein LSH36_127g03000 [Paralvinella palmiformis]